jgi:hypothetical protein
MVEVLNALDEDEIRSGKTRADQVVKLMDILPRRGLNAFSCFLRALESEQRFLAVMLRKAENSNAA